MASEIALRATSPSQRPRVTSDGCDDHQRKQYFRHTRSSHLFSMILGSYASISLPGMVDGVVVLFRKGLDAEVRMILDSDGKLPVLDVSNSEGGAF